MFAILTITSLILCTALFHLSPPVTTSVHSTILMVWLAASSKALAVMLFMANSRVVG